MGEHRARLIWTRNGAAFVDQRYSREHSWSFDGGIRVPASSSPKVIPEPMSTAAAVDPEEAFVAALASCHMLLFLSIAAQAGLVVEQYEDDASGVLERQDDGTHAITKVQLRPTVRYHGSQPTLAMEAQLHHRAHGNCYLANSVRSTVEILSGRSSLPGTCA